MSHYATEVCKCPVLYQITAFYAHLDDCFKNGNCGLFVRLCKKTPSFIFLGDIPSDIF